MKYLLLLLMANGAYAQTAFFNASIYNQDTGRTKFISGQVDYDLPDKPVSKVALMTERIRRSTEDLRQQIDARRQLNELKSQTEYLRIIANKQ